MVYFTRGLGVAPGVGDVLAESHIASNGSLKYTCVYVQDHRGDTIALVSNSAVVARYEYDAWGQVASHTGADAWFTFSGKHYDADAGLYYYGFRWYDPVAKRWTQPDPSGLTEGLDLYRFCQNNAVCCIDINGLKTYLVTVGNDVPQDQVDITVRHLYEMITSSDTIWIAQVRTACELSNWLSKYDDIAAWIYIGHGGIEQLTLSTNNTVYSKSDNKHAGIDQMPTKGFLPEAFIMFISCRSAVPWEDQPSMAEAAANHFQRPVLGAGSGVSWTWLGPGIRLNWRIKDWLFNSGGGGWKWFEPKE